MRLPGVRRTISMILSEAEVARIEPLIDREVRKHDQNLRKAVEARAGNAAFSRVLALPRKR